jgi:cell division protein FtsZ
MTLYEVDEAANRIREEVDPEANIIFGSTFNEKMNGRMRVSVVATGIDAAAMKQKKQVYEEMATVRAMQSESAAEAAMAAASSVADGAANVEERSQPILGVVRNSAPGPAVQVESVRKKPQSLFERLTGMRRSFSSDRREEFVVQQPKIQPGTQEEDLEIPAFLRKNS